MADSFQQATSIASNPVLELSSRGQTLRFELSKDLHQLGRDPAWADLEVTHPEWTVMSRRQAVLKREGSNYRIFDGDGHTPSRNGIFVNQTRVTVVEGYLLQDGAQLEIGLAPESRILVNYRSCPSFTSGRPSGSVAQPSRRRLSLENLQEWPVEIGRAPSRDRYAAMELDAPTVSRLHAFLYPDGAGGHVLQDSSANGTFVNGNRIEKRTNLNPGDTIRIGPFALVYDPRMLVLEDTGSQIRLDAHSLLRKVQNKQGNEFTILNDISLVIEPGQLVALVGGSGAGKSTLMKSLVGIEPTTSGVVFLNGENLRQNWGVYRSQIGYVPQDDIVHRNLTVEEVLTYACKLRLPPDADVEQVVNRTLDQIKLPHVRHTFVRNLSGGQRKRVSIGVELLADPKLFFLDEPTSGLDPGLDKEMMRLLRELADQGRTVVLVTHATANIEVCDRIVFLGRGGHLCYFGPPLEALSFFRMPEVDLKYFSDIYIKLDQGSTSEETRTIVQGWSQHYRNSPNYGRYVGASLSAGKPERSKKAKEAVYTGISPLKQLWLLSQRYGQLILRDRLSQILTLISGPIAIAFTALILWNEEPLAQLDPPEPDQASLALRLAFVFSSIAIWIGLSSAVREIVKESAIYTRERLINLGLFSYLGSKLLIWMAIALLQTLLMTVAIWIGFQSPESSLLPWSVGVAITNFLTILASICLSLAISAFVKSENAANNLLPLIMIPQIIFSGVLFDLEGIAQKLSWLMISRWSVGAYGTLIQVNDMATEAIEIPGQDPIEPIFEAVSTYDATWANLGHNWGILAVHMLVYLAAALVLQKRKDLL
ncbi:ATP-binding cassette domain-containing protein [Romeria aff. gracilis LEGE 07310]|uniref:ATP-binding cassette domain-containing protein n=1 Tax=Vasconcelosia minhoensis LEGE 07310 TaxID=915328 RepID=A0A8J7AIV1_9CYAN|nr:ATP-binding cassette domain-containing protein [Romeria gracilis]MBE9079886.1 ATP-binding cassette domain-containing protein [Romeria aff. gracilis LEGE 07310]